MKRYFTIAPSMLLFIVLLFPLFSANKIEKPQPIKQITTAVPNSSFFKDPISEMHRVLLSEAIESYFDRALRQNKIVGVGVGVVKCDSAIYLGGFGKRSAYLKDEIDKETIFRIGSVSKGFAGILSSMYVEEGILNWEDKVHDYIPSFKLSNKNWTDNVTLSHILSQSSGVPHHSFTNLIEEGFDLTEIANRFKKISSLSKPGSIYNYQNAMFALSGEMIEKATGKSYGEAIAEKIFRPLGMNTASTDYNALISSSNIAMPHKKRGRRWRSLKINQKYYNAIPAGGVNASISDMAKWMRFLLGHNPDVMPAAGLKNTFNPKISLPGKNKYYQKWDGHKESYYAHGWRIHDLVENTTGESNRIIHHGGYVNNYRSEIAIFPQEDLGVTVLFNSPTKLAKNVIPDLHKIIKKVMEMPEEELLAEVSNIKKSM